jgi:hypothetical protein
VQLLLAAGGNPNLADLERLFNSETQPETGSAYLLAAALVSDIRQRHGAAAPGAIVDRVARGAVFAEAFALETGETPDEAAARAWQIYRRWTSWIPVVISASSLWVGIMALAVIAFRSHRRWRRRRQWELGEVNARDASQTTGDLRRPWRSATPTRRCIEVPSRLSRRPRARIRRPLHSFLGSAPSPSVGLDPRTRSPWFSSHAPRRDRSSG